jgi:hypothetical protein
VKKPAEPVEPEEGNEEQTGDDAAVNELEPVGDGGLPVIGEGAQADQPLAEDDLASQGGYYEDGNLVFE